VGQLLIGLVQNKILKAICDKRVLVEMVLKNDFRDGFEKGGSSRRMYVQSFVHITKLAVSVH
jgi:hypothetical protein